MNFRTVQASGAANFRRSAYFAEAGIEVLHNEPDEVRAAVREMYLHSDGLLPLEEEDYVRQNLFRAQMQPKNYSFDSESMISPYFLRMWEDLL